MTEYYYKPHGTIYTFGMLRIDVHTEQNKPNDCWAIIQ